MRILSRSEASRFVHLRRVFHAHSTDRFSLFLQIIFAGDFAQVRSRLSLSSARRQDRLGSNRSFSDASVLSSLSSFRRSSKTTRARTETSTSPSTRTRGNRPFLPANATSSNTLIVRRTLSSLGCSTGCDLEFIPYETSSSSPAWRLTIRRRSRRTPTTRSTPMGSSLPSCKPLSFASLQRFRSSSPPRLFSLSLSPSLFRCPRNETVDIQNQQRLDALEGEGHVYTALDDNSGAVEKLKNSTRKKLDSPAKALEGLHR